VQPLAGRLLLPRLLSPFWSRHVLKLLPDKAAARALNALVRNTVTPTVLRAGEKINVIPAVAEAELDGRTLPGQSPEDLLREIEAVIGQGLDLEVVRALEPVEAPALTPMFEHLAQAVKRMDPEGEAVPNLIPGFTDAGPFSTLGTVYYGFSPVWFPPSPPVAFAELYHGDDERIFVEGFHRGLAALHEAVRSWVTREEAAPSLRPEPQP
jgi:acetylornithine deacetylase/succinyl-diaminopimelate desuccinylase-like protein